METEKVIRNIWASIRSLFVLNLSGTLRTYEKHSDIHSSFAKELGIYYFVHNDKENAIKYMNKAISLYEKTLLKDTGYDKEYVELIAIRDFILAGNVIRFLK